MTVEHTAQAREIVGPDAILAPEQMVVLDTDLSRRSWTRRARAWRVYLRAPNYVNNLMRLGFTEDDLADGGSDRLVDAIVACGDVDTAVERVQAHFDAGASHVCVQVFEDEFTAVPERGGPTSRPASASCSPES